MKKKRVVKTKKQNFGGGTKKIKGGGLEDLDLMNQNPKTNKVAKKKQRTDIVNSNQKTNQFAKQKQRKDMGKPRQLDKKPKPKPNVPVHKRRRKRNQKKFKKAKKKKKPKKEEWTQEDLDKISSVQDMFNTQIEFAQQMGQDSEDHQLNVQQKKQEMKFAQEEHELKMQQGKQDLQKNQPQEESKEEDKKKVDPLPKENFAIKNMAIDKDNDPCEGFWLEKSSNPKDYDSDHYFEFNVPGQVTNGWKDGHEHEYDYKGNCV